MKFSKVITTDMSEVKAYRLKPGTRLQEDPQVRAAYIENRGQNRWHDVVDSFYDCPDRIAEGEDGKLYGVGYIYDEGLVPAVWQEVERKEG